MIICFHTDSDGRWILGGYGEVSAALDRIGAAGWELVAVQLTAVNFGGQWSNEDHPQSRYIFKRPLNYPPPPPPPSARS